MKSTAPEVKIWRTAINSELMTVEEKGTWLKVGSFLRNTNRFTVRDEQGSTILPTHHVLRIKSDENGNPSKFKARVVAGGNFQIKGTDYDAVYEPVIDFSLILLVFAFIVQYGWHSCPVDVKAAFLNGEIDKDVFVAHPMNLSP